ncbi:MAG: hypothetical protein K0U98_25980 [Deltaproteobacteria bacterium]|nr:hypothetical protein [Deltaproteobacteria bacterium]
MSSRVFRGVVLLMRGLIRVAFVVRVMGVPVMFWLLVVGGHRVIFLGRFSRRAGEGKSLVFDMI